MSEDVVTLLERQHEEIRALFGNLAQAGEDDRAQIFHDLVRLLSVHETAEEEIVHPEVRRLQGGDPVVDARLGEEHRAKELLSTLEHMGPGADGFDTLLIQLRDDVLAHAEHEEREEFPLLRTGCADKRRAAMAEMVKAAEAMAPTHPHPGVESAAENVLLGPPAAIMDRVRDGLRKLLRG